MTTLVLLVATGFMGACLVIYLGRYVLRSLVPQPTYAVHFSPKGGCGKAIIQELESAQSQILVMAFSFTYDPIVTALMNAHDRGVDVQLLFDGSNESEQRSDMPRCIEKGMKVLVDSEHSIAHSKIMVIDQKTIVTGSFNFTRQAEDANGENVLIIKHDKVLAEKYLQNFENHKVHAREPKLKPGAGSKDAGRVDIHKKAA